MVAAARLLACRDLDRVACLVARQSRFAESMKGLRATREKEHHYLLCAPAALAIALLDRPWPQGRAFRLVLLGIGHVRHIASATDIAPVARRSSGVS